MNKDKQLHVRISTEDAIRLSKQAKKEGVRVSEIVRRVLTDEKKCKKIVLLLQAYDDLRHEIETNAKWMRQSGANLNQVMQVYHAARADGDEATVADIPNAVMQTQHAILQYVQTMKKLPL